MSTFAYARITATRASQPGVDTFASDKPGVGPTLDALAALVPAEVLAAHAVVLGLTTSSSGEGEQARTIITKASELRIGFWGLLAAALVVYVIGRASAGWKKSDFLRMLIPPVAFVGGR
jgi:hypothetical protein